LKKFIKKKLFVILLKLLTPVIQYINMHVHSCYGSNKRLHISNKANVCNTLFNTFSGDIHVDDYVFMGHNVSIITGTHDYSKTLKDRMFNAPIDGGDINIKKGVWVGSNSTILGPCNIGVNSVIAAGSVITKDIPDNVIVAGVPGKIIKKLKI